MHSIRVRITAITVVLILACILAVIGACFTTVRAETDRSSAENMNLLSRNTQQSLDDYLDSVEQSVEMVASIASDSLDSVTLVEGGVAGAKAKTRAQTPEQEAALDAYLASYSERVQEAFGSVASHTQGIVTYYYCIATDISRNEHGFFYSKVGKTGFEKQPPLDARELDPDDIEHTTWYYTPIQRGRPSWVGPYRAHFLGETWTLSYLVPIYKAGTFIGVLGMDIFLDTMLEQIKPIRVYNSGYACLLDENGRVYYHPAIESGSTPDEYDSAAPVQMLRRHDSGDELIRYTVNGQERQMAFSTLSNGMKLAVIAPVDEVMAPWVRLTRYILAASAVIVAIFAVILMYAMGVITRPLLRLTAASRLLADGNYDVVLDYKGRDEVGTLTRAFTQMRDHIQQYIADLNRRIYTDDLTGLPNMRSFFRQALAARERILEAGGRPALLYFDLTGMKHYNVQRGFEAGDALIRDVGEILRRHYGVENCARFGQDHFTAVTDEAGLEEELTAVFAECREANGGMSLPVRVGIYPDRLGSVDVNVAADRAKFACDQKRGSYVSEWTWFDKAMLSRNENHRYIINTFDRALEEGWIKVYYQPIVRAANGRVCDEEALARWQDPEKGLLSPAQFIPVLESAGLIYRLDLYVLDQILLKMQEQARAGLYVVPQSLNLSRADFDACDITEEICRRVDAAGIERDKLSLELTESIVGSDFDFIREQVARMHERGFQVWMDDFGSGYSSLDVLQSIHFDLIKLDMRFLQHFDEGDECKIILTEMVKMAVSLGIDTIAEGVETKDQAEFLREVGCTKLQGYYFSKPITFEQILERHRTGTQIGYEDPYETGYYTLLGRINLYDLTTMSSESGDEFGNFFDTLPMALIESDEQSLRIVRCNRAYRDFLKRLFNLSDLGGMNNYAAAQEGVGYSFSRAVKQCRGEGERVFIDETLPDGRLIRAMMRNVAINPVTGIVASAVAVLGVTDASGHSA